MSNINVNAIILLKIFRKIKSIVFSNVYTFLFSVSCNSFGRNSKVMPGVYLMYPGRCTIGNDCLISEGVRITSELNNSDIMIGNNVQINNDVFLDHTGNLSIDDGVLISEGAIIYTHDHGLDPRSEPAPMSKAIGRSAWVGVRAILLPGCRVVGENAIIGAGAVVARDVPERAVVAGNPAKIIRYLEA